MGTGFPSHPGHPAKGPAYDPVPGTGQVRCPACGNLTEPAPFCDLCGTSLGRACSACNSPNRPEARFCSQCGTGLGAVAPPVPPAAAQHKQVTVLFADICNSTQLVADIDAEDASLVLEPVLQVISTAVRRFGGIVIHRLGDGVMALFGAPVAAEDHAVSACFAALAIQADVGRMGRQPAQQVPGQLPVHAAGNTAGHALAVRVGICSGPVVLRRTGRDEDDYGVAGVTAHIASRLEQHAEPGAILLAPQTLRLVAGVARTEPVGPVHLKGLPRPLDVFRLLSARDRPSWRIRSDIRGMSPFVGRAHDLAGLAAALRRAGTGGMQALALVGDGGLGKSRLVHEFLGTVPPGDWHVFRIDSTAQLQAVPYVLLTAILRQLAGCAAEDGLGDIAARLPASVAVLGLAAGHDLSPLLLHLNQEAGTGYAVPSHAAHREDLAGALAPILRRYSELHPLVLVVEDYHWLDASSADLLEALRARLPGARLLLLVTTRPERRPAWAHPPGAEPGAAAGAIELLPLTASQSDALLSDLVGGGEELAPLRKVVVARAGGTPFFLEEIAQSLREQDALAAGRTPRLDDIVVPASVQGILAARFDRLAPEHRRVLQIAAVVGQEMPARLLAAAVDTHAAALADALAALRTARFITSAATPGGDTVHSFCHALTQAVAYDTLLRSDRRVVHERVLHALEAQNGGRVGGDLDQLAHHAVRAEAWPAASRYTMAAGERASRRLAPTEARAYFLSAIDALRRQPATPATIGQGIDAWLGLRTVSMHLGDDAGPQGALHDALAEAGQLATQASDRMALARVYVSRGAVSSFMGDLSGSVAISRTALAVMREHGDATGIVAAAFALVQALWLAGDFLDAQTVIDATLAHARSPEGQLRGNATFVMPAVSFLCYRSRILSDLGRHDESRVAIAEARQVALGKGMLFDQVLVDLNEGAALLTAGQVGQAVELLERVREVARANALDWHMSSISVLLGTGLVELGRNVEAREILEGAMAVANRNRYVAHRLRCCPPLVLALAGAPFHEVEAARALAERTLHEAGTFGFKPVVRQTRAALERLAFRP